MKKLTFLAMFASVVSLADGSPSYKSEYKPEKAVNPPVTTTLEVKVFKPVHGEAPAIAAQYPNYGTQDRYQAFVQYNQAYYQQVCAYAPYYPQYRSECDNYQLGLHLVAKQTEGITAAEVTESRSDKQSECATVQLKELNSALSKSKDALDFYKSVPISKVRIELYDGTLNKPEDNAGNKPLKNEELTIGMQVANSQLLLRGAIGVDGKCIPIESNRIIKEFALWKAEPTKFVADKSQPMPLDFVNQVDVLMFTLNSPNYDAEMKKIREPARKNPNIKPGTATGDLNQSVGARMQ